jgi:hypothetical protein
MTRDGFLFVSCGLWMAGIWSYLYLKPVIDCLTSPLHALLVHDLTFVDCNNRDLRGVGLALVFGTKLSRLDLMNVF